MDTFAKALLISNDIIENSDYQKMRKERYASFDNGDGKSYEQGMLKLEDLRRIALKNGEPQLISGKQELFEQIINNYI